MAHNAPAKNPLWSETDRLAELDQFRIVHTAPEAEFDAIVQEAAALTGAPVSLITLLTEDHQWFKAAVGTSITGTARAISFCTHAIEQHETMVVNDASNDPRFAENPLVTSAPHIRFYAGVPLHTDKGLPLGTLCVIGQEPQVLTELQQAALEALATKVLDLLEARKARLQAIEQKIA